MTRPTTVSLTTAKHLQNEATPTHQHPHQHRPRINFQSFVGSILILFTLNLYVNIADLGRSASRSLRPHVTIQEASEYKEDNTEFQPSTTSNNAEVKEAKPPPSSELSSANGELQEAKPSFSSEAVFDDERNGNPTLVLHMGPTKTASTFTQCVLTSMGKTLALDNYTYVGMGINPCLPGNESPQRYIQHCYDSMFAGPPRNAKVGPSAQRIFRRARLKGKNAIMVNECFQFYKPKQIKVLIAELEPSWNVKIIMSYRRIYEFLPSSYNQNLKPKPYMPEFELWPGERARIGAVIDDATTGTKTREMVMGRHLAPFDIEKRDRFTTQFQTMEREGLHPVEEVRRLYGHVWPNITIVKLHELKNRTGVSAGGGGDVGLQHIFCTILKDTPHSCEAVKLDSTVAVADAYHNSFQPFDYELLAVEAFRQELFGFQQRDDGLVMKRKHAVKRIKNHQENTLNLTALDFPRICLKPEKLDRIINASLFVERTLFPEDDITPEIEAEHRQAFVEYNDKKKRYCAIDVQKTLLDTQWRSFLASF